VHKVRLIARIDVKNEFVIKGIHLEGLRKIGDPLLLAKKYYEAGIDEIIFMDAVASLYGRNNLFHIIENACKEVFIPITIGGGVRSIHDIDAALKSGADKITLNTQAIKNPELIKEASRIYGSQCIVGSIEAKRKGNSWEAYIDNGREETGIDVLEWAKKIEQLGAGELLVTSIDQEGTKKGFELELMENISKNLSIPVIASGGCGNLDHISESFLNTDISAIAIASILHYDLFKIQEIKNHLTQVGIKTRQ
jgi:cyclase